MHNSGCARCGKDVICQSKVSRCTSDAVHLFVWPKAMRMAVQTMIYLPDEAHSSFCIEKNSHVEVQGKLQHFHTFGCPEHALTLEAQNTNARKWDASQELVHT